MIYKFLQKLPLFKGKLRLAKVLIFNKEKPRQFTINHGLTIAVPNLIENISFELLVNGIYEQYIIDLITSSSSIQILRKGSNAMSAKY